jgi:two-component system sensor histidine kinase KdpD
VSGEDFRPDPDALLQAINKEEPSTSGHLRIFFGMSAGVGKTFAMLKAAQQIKTENVDVVIGYIETHGRRETEALVGGLSLIPRKQIQYKGTTLEEMDLDAILARKPTLVLVDELAHTNAPGSRHPKRYQDVIEILDAGIDVYTTLNVQHLESRKEAVEKITGITIRETLPDSILERASQIELVDITPTDLLKRLREGKVYLGDRAVAAQQGFFKDSQLTALREIALRLTAERVDQELAGLMQARQIAGPWNTSERLMCAVSHSPYSERLVRATRRLAYNLEAPWIAVNVDMGIALNDVDHAQLVKNLNLAAELGGEVVAIKDANIRQALQRVARQRNVTQLIVGRPTRRWLRELWEGGSLLDQLVRDSGDLDVHVVREEKSEKPGRLRIPNLAVQSSFTDYWYAFWYVLGVSIFSSLIVPFVGYRAVGYVFLLGVLLMGLVSSLGPIVAAALASSVIWDYFFIPPHFTFRITETEDMIMCSAFFIAALTSGILTSRVRRHENLHQEREDRTALLYEIARDIASARKQDEFLKQVLERLSISLGGQFGVALSPDGRALEFAQNSPFFSDDKEKAVAEWAFRNSKSAGWSTDTLPVAKALYVPMRTPNLVVGVLIYRPASLERKPSIQDGNLLSAVARQLAVSIERESLRESARSAGRLQESEKLHQALLNSISHEMRTPLTTIIGTATALADASIAADVKSRESLSHELVDACERLNRTVENLLDMSRLSSGVLALQKEWHDVGDLVGVSLRRFQKQLASRLVVAHIPDDLPLVEMDFRLMENVLSNLLLNAIAYTPDNTIIEITAERLDDQLLLIVGDRGRGIPAELLDTIFNKFYRVAGTPAGGTGLGLSISRTIVEAHGGELHAQNRIGGGAEFVISLPLGSPPSAMLAETSDRGTT